MANKLGRPLQGDKKRERSSFTLPPDLQDWLKQQAHAYKTTISGVVERILAEARFHQPETLALWQERFPISMATLQSICIRYHIQKLSLFGSVLRPDFGPNSDIDILVEFDTNHPPGFFMIARLERELSRLLGKRKVDIKTPKEISRYFREEVLKNSETLYAA